MTNKKTTTDWEEKVKDVVEDKGLASLPSAAMQTVYRQIYDASLTNAPVLVLGETGVGKDQIAGIIHALNPENDSIPFKAANCAAWSASDSAWARGELFGKTDNETQGTWEERWQDGLVHKADGGIAFLDEIGELVPQVQAQLLRMIETGEVMPHNGFPPDMPLTKQKELSQVNVRVIAGTNRDVRDPAVLRQDLYYRLSACVITVPPLQERPEDIWVLAQVLAQAWFIEEENKQKVDDLIKASYSQPVLEALVAVAKRIKKLKADVNSAVDKDIEDARKADNNKFITLKDREKRFIEDAIKDTEFLTLLNNLVTPLKYPAPLKALNAAVKAIEAATKALNGRKKDAAVKAKALNAAVKAIEAATKALNGTDEPAAVTAAVKAIEAATKALNGTDEPAAVTAAVKELNTATKALKKGSKEDAAVKLLNDLVAALKSGDDKAAVLETFNKFAPKIPKALRPLLFAQSDRDNEKNPEQVNVRALLKSAPWKGNVRDLKQTLERALTSAKDLPLGPNDFPALKAAQCYEAGNQALRRNQLDVAAKHQDTAAKQAKKAGGDLQKIFVDASSARADAHLKRAEVLLPTLAHVPSTWKDVKDVWEAYNDALEDLEQIPSPLRSNDVLKLQAEVCIKRAELYRRYPRLLLHAHTPESGKNGSPPTDCPVEDYSHAIDAYSQVLKMNETPAKAEAEMNETLDKAEAYCLRGKAYLRRGAARRFPRLLYGAPHLTLIRAGVVRDWDVLTMVDQILTASALSWRLAGQPDTVPILRDDFLFSRSVVLYAISVVEIWKREGEAHEKLCDLRDRYSENLNRLKNWAAERLGKVLKYGLYANTEDVREILKKDLCLPDDKKPAYGLTVPDEAAGLADIADALDDFDEGLRLDSENADGHFHKGVALLASSRLGVAKSRLAAISCFKKTLHLDSGYGEADEEFWGTLALAALAQHVLTLDGDWESLLGRPVKSRDPDGWKKGRFLSFVRFGAVSKRQPDGVYRHAGLKVDALAPHETLQSYIDIFTAALVVMKPQEIWQTLTDTYNELSLSSREAEFMNVAKDFWHRVFYAPSVEPMLLRQPRHKLKRRYCFICEELDTSLEVDDFIELQGLPPG